MPCWSHPIPPAQVPRASWGLPLLSPACPGLAFPWVSCPAAFQKSLSAHVSPACERWALPHTARPPGRGALGAQGPPLQVSLRTGSQTRGLACPGQLTPAGVSPSVPPAQPFITLTKQILTKDQVMPSILLKGSHPGSLCPLSIGPRPRQIPGQSFWLPGLFQVPRNPSMV